MKVVNGRELFSQKPPSWMSGRVLKTKLNFDKKAICSLLSYRDSTYFFHFRLSLNIAAIPLLS